MSHEAVTRIGQPRCGHAGVDTIEGEGLTDSGTVIIDGNDDNVRGRGGAALIGRYGNAGTGGCCCAHAIVSWSDEFAEISQGIEFFCRSSRIIAKSFIVGIIIHQPPVMVGVHICGDQAVMDPHGLGQARRHGGIIGRAVDV